MNIKEIFGVDGNIIWEEHESESGKMYQIGYLEEEKSDEEKEKNKLTKKVPFSVDVDWKINSAASFYEAFQKQTGITNYSLKYFFSDYDPYLYTLYFTNIEHYDYHFTDATGDRYRCNTYRNGNHLVSYNSKDARVVKIEGK